MDAVGYGAPSTHLSSVGTHRAPEITGEVAGRDSPSGVAQVGHLLTMACGNRPALWEHQSTGGQLKGQVLGTPLTSWAPGVFGEGQC